MAMRSLPRSRTDEFGRYQQQQQQRQHAAGSSNMSSANLPTNSERRPLLSRPLAWFAEDSERSVWCRMIPRHWPENLVTLLQKASGDERCSCDKALQILMSEKPRAEVRKNWKDYLLANADAEDAVVKAIYQLIHLAPTVAGMLLDLSLVADTERELYMSLKGKIQNLPMKSKYVMKEDVPTERETQTALDWSDPNVFEVTRYECLVPNILNINILQALAKTDNVDMFAKKSVQAIVRCIWDEQVVWVIGVNMFLAILEVITLLQWGLSTKDGLPFDRISWRMQHSASDEDWLKAHGFEEDPAWLWRHVKAWSGERFGLVRWSILVALNLEQFVEFLNMWINARRCTLEADDGVTKDLWKDAAKSWQWPLWLNSSFYHFLIRTAFLVIICFPIVEHNVMAYAQQLMLGLTYITSVLGMFTFFVCFSSEFGLSLVSMRRTLLDAAVLHLFFIMVLAFVIVMLAWMILDREETLLSSLQIGWRALILSDEDGISELSDVSEVDNRKIPIFGYVAQGGAFLGIFFFSTFLTNLLIAIFSDAYHRAQQKKWVSFFKRRIIIARNCILAQPARTWGFPLTQNHQMRFAGPGVVTAVLLQVGVHYVKSSAARRALSVVSVFVFVMVIRWLKASLFQFIDGENSWFSAKPAEDCVMIVWCRKDFNEKTWLMAEEDIQLDGKLESLTDEISDMKNDLRRILHKLETH